MEEKFTLAKWSNYTKNNKAPRSISQVNQQKNNEKKDFKNNKNDSVHKDPMNKNQTQVNQKESKTNLIRNTNPQLKKLKVIRSIMLLIPEKKFLYRKTKIYLRV